MSNFITFVFTHKDFQLPSIKGNFKIIKLGQSNLNDNYDVQVFKDSQGDNISYKNPTHCELTGLYWLFKNAEINQNEIISLAHYRRYLIISDYKDNSVNSIINAIKSNQIDFVVPKRVRNYTRFMNIPFPLSIEQAYKLYHIKEDWEIMIKVMKNMHPNQVNLINKVSNRNYMFAYNIFMCKGDRFANYCSWLFEILESIEKEVRVSEYSYQKRVFGFLAERLFNYYIELQNLKIKEIETIFHDQE